MRKLLEYMQDADSEAMMAVSKIICEGLEENTVVPSAAKPTLELITNIDRRFIINPVMACDVTLDKDIVSDCTATEFNVLVDELRTKDVHVTMVKNSNVTIKHGED